MHIKASIAENIVFVNILVTTHGSILYWLPYDDKLASSRFSKSTHQRYGNSIKRCTKHNAHLLVQAIRLTYCCLHVTISINCYAIESTYGGFLSYFDFNLWQFVTGDICVMSFVDILAQISMHIRTVGTEKYTVRF